MPFVRVDDPTGVAAVTPLKQSTMGGSGSFLVLADDGRRYWCKALSNTQGARVLVNEQIVVRLGAAIGASVCGVELVYVGSDLAGWEYRPGQTREEGWTHGSLTIDRESLAVRDRRLPQECTRAGVT